MTLQTVALSTLQPPTKNPRSFIEQKALAGLSESIRTDGVLQNLIVSLTNNAKKPYRIISGERRFRALQILRKSGEIGTDYQVPVEIREGLSFDDAARIATVENVQREKLPALDEAKVFKTLVHDGVTLDEIEAQTGVSASTITRRLALNNLCAEAQEALSGGDLSLVQAEALSIGKHEAQLRVLDCALSGGYRSGPEHIKEALTFDKPSKALAIFPLEQYSGTFMQDLFADDECTYFDDVEQFTLLQEAAVKVLAASYVEKADWVEITENHALRDWVYEKAPKGERGGVLINLAPDGEVEVKTGLLKTQADEETLEEVTQAPNVPKKSKATYAKSLCTYIAHHKTLAVQSLLLGDARKAKEVAIVQLLGDRYSSIKIDWKPHKAFGSFEAALDQPSAYKTLENEAKAMADLLGENVSIAPSWRIICNYHENEAALYAALEKLSDSDLERLLTFVLVMSFGQRYCDELDTEASVFNAVARDLKVDMGQHWMPDRAFLEKRNTEQLLAIARESGFAEGRGFIAGYKKGELVTGLERFFTQAHEADEPDEAQKKALTWLPEAFAFPAINPDAGE